jgi:hypothetical protein
MALEATTEPFWRWEEHVGPELEARGFDECSIPPDTLEGMSDEDRLAQVARLLRSLSLTYGVSTEFGSLGADWSAKRMSTRRLHSFAA